MASSSEAPRYRLTLLRYPSLPILSQVCDMVYHNQDKNLIGAMSSVPYTVGRSFVEQEAKVLHQELAKLEVSHKFQSGTSQLPDLIFDSQEKTKPISARSASPLHALRDVLHISVILIALCALGAVAYFSWPYISRLSIFSKVVPDVEMSPEEVKRDQEATVERIEKDVEFRRHEEFAWNKASTNLVLAKQDAIRTFADSTAVLRYREGSLVTVKPETLLVIGTNPEPSERILQLQNGSLQANLKHTRTPHSLSIQTSSGTLELKNPIGGEKETRVETSLSGGTLTVAVTQGKVKLFSPSHGSAPVEISSLQKVMATKDSISKPEAFTPEIHLTNPKSDGDLQVDPQGITPVRFNWEALGDKAHYVWKVSTDPAMKEILLQQSTSSNHISLNYLDLGTLYWQVTGDLDGVPYTSAIWKVHVQKANH